MDKYSVRQLALYAIVLAGVIAVVYIAVTAMGVPIPQWIINILWVIGVVFIAVLAIRIITGMGSGDPKV